MVINIKKEPNKRMTICHRTGTEYFQVIYLSKDMYPEYAEKSLNDSKKANYSIIDWTEVIAKEHTHMAKKHLKSCPVSIALGKCQFKVLHTY